MNKIQELSAKMLGRTINETNLGEIEELIIPEQGNRLHGSFTTERQLPEGFEVQPEYEYIEAVIKEKEPELLFITGEAGTGKSTLIHWLVKRIQCCALVAPTAVAANNIQGSTIHSFFGLPARHIEPDEEYKPSAISCVVMANIKCLIIDEISMVPPNLLDAMDLILKRVRKCNAPFGGVNVLLIGDLFQLPPVVGSEEESVYYTHRYKSPYFFSADVLKEVGVLPVILKNVKRQNQPEIIEALANIRNGYAYRDSLALFNQNCFSKDHNLDKIGTCLVPTNNLAKQINENKLSAINKPLMKFTAEITGKVQADKWKLVVPDILNIKVGAKVLFLNNQSEWINGDLGEVVSFGDDCVRVKKLNTDNVVSVPRHTWYRIAHAYNYSTKKVEQTIIGKFYQYPLALGWAITIHKSQGMTFENYSIDIGRGAFSDGQVYVALSRAKSLSSVKLIRPLAMSDVKVSPVVQDFYRRLQDL